MDESFPGPRTRAALERGIPFFKNGLRFDAEMERAGQRGFRAVRQIVIDKAEGDFVWDLDGRRYIDFQNSWATTLISHPARHSPGRLRGVRRRRAIYFE